MLGSLGTSRRVHNARGWYEYRESGGYVMVRVDRSRRFPSNPFPCLSVRPITDETAQESARNKCTGTLGRSESSIRCQVDARRRLSVGTQAEAREQRQEQGEDRAKEAQEERWKLRIGRHELESPALYLAVSYPAQSVSGSACHV
jgi:hypothetical protein